MVATLMMSVKLAIPGLLKVKLFWNKGYDNIIFDKMFWCHADYIVDVYIWPKFGKSSISLRAVVTTSFL